jgi:oxaloacetate decarboxylase alpha subunit
MDYEFLAAGETHKVSLDRTEGKVIAILNGKRLELDVCRVSPRTFSLVSGGKCYLAHVARQGRRLMVAVGASCFCLEVPEEPGASTYAGAAPSQDDGKVKAPMPGLVVKVDVTEGAEVQPGDVLVVVEAMKMEHELRAAFKAVVAKVHVKAGQQVDAFQPLLDLERLGP